MDNALRTISIAAGSLVLGFFESGKGVAGAGLAHDVWQKAQV
jgi:hypothetical protein